MWSRMLVCVMLYVLCVEGVSVGQSDDVVRCRADFDSSGVVDFNDFLIFLNVYGKGTPSPNRCDLLRTVFAIRRDTIEIPRVDTITVIVRDTIIQTRIDTVEVEIEVEVEKAILPDGVKIFDGFGAGVAGRCVGEYSFSYTTRDYIVYSLAALDIDADECRRRVQTRQEDGNWRNQICQYKRAIDIDRYDRQEVDIFIEFLQTLPDPVHARVITFRYQGRVYEDLFNGLVQDLELECN